MKKQKYSGLEQNKKKESIDKKEEDEIGLKEKNENAKINFEQKAFFDRLVQRLEAKKEKESRLQPNQDFNSRNSILIPKLLDMTTKDDVPALAPLAPSVPAVQIPTFKKIDETKSISNRDKEDEVKENKKINEGKEKDKMEDTRPIYQENTKAKFEEERNPIEIHSEQYTPMTIKDLEKFLDSM